MSDKRLGWVSLDLDDSDWQDVPAFYFAGLEISEEGDVLHAIPCYEVQWRPVIACR